MQYESPLHRPAASFLRHALVVRRASCGLQRQASAALLARRRCAYARCHRDEAQHLSLLRGRRAALVVVGSFAVERHCANERPLSLGTRLWCDTSDVASNTKCQASAACHDVAQAHRRSLSLGRRCSAQAYCALVPCRAGRGWLVSYRSSLRQREAALFCHALVVRRAN